MIVKFQHAYFIRQLYAIGNHSDIIDALRSTFLCHGMKIHKDEDKALIFYPGGNFDLWNTRLTNGYLKFASSGPGRSIPDAFGIKYYQTNNPLVTLLRVSLAHKLDLGITTLAKKRFATFHDAFDQEISARKIVIVDNDDWPKLLAKRPEFKCLPEWVTTHEYNTLLRAQLIKSHGKEEGERLFENSQNDLNYLKGVTCLRGGDRDV